MRLITPILRKKANLVWGGGGYSLFREAVQIEIMVNQVPFFESMIIIVSNYLDITVYFK